MAHKTLTPEIRAVLERSTITESSLVLPGQLPRKLYEDVNAVILNAGGKWDRRAKAHLFDRDPREKLGLVLESGVSIDTKKKRQAFYTPAALADEIALMADVAGHVVLEPSAGGGALADACMKFGAASVDCIEIDPEESETLRGRGYKTICGDFLGVDTDRLYRRIVMNPPFSANQDIKHVAHALKCLRSADGILVSVISGNTDRNALKRLLTNMPHTIRPLGAGAFKQSGTNVATAILIVKTPDIVSQ